MKKRLLPPFLQTRFMKRIASVAVPVLIISILEIITSLVDTSMVSILGDHAVSSVGIAGPFYNLLNIVFFGVGSGSAIFFSRFFGSGDTKQLQITVVFYLAFTFALSILSSSFLFIFGKPILSLYTNSPQVLKGALEYYNILIFSYPIQGITIVLVMLFRMTNMAKISMFCIATALATNFIGNYLFIFGSLITPALGVKGAAIGTFIAKLIVLLLHIITLKKYRPQFFPKWKFLALVNQHHFLQLIQITLPIISTNFLFAISFNIYSGTFGNMGVPISAAFSVVIAIHTLFTTPSIAFSSSAISLLGEMIGKYPGNLLITQGLTKRLLKLNQCLAFIMALLLFFFQDFIIQLYHLSEEAKTIAKQMTSILILFLPIRLPNILLNQGILRAGGDTYFSLFLILFCNYGISLLAVIVGFQTFQLQAHWIFALIFIGDIPRFILAHFRIASPKKWIHLNHEKQLKITTEGGNP